MEPEYNDFDGEADHFSGYIDSDFFEADAGPVDDADNGAEEPDDSSFDYNTTLSKSVLWDQEAALLGFLFKNYERKVESIGRQTEMGSMLSAIAVEILSLTSDQEPLSRVRDRLSILKELRLQVPQIMEGLNGAVDDFQSGLEHINSGWDTQRLDRAILTYLLRMRYMKTALVFAKRRHMMVITLHSCCYKICSPLNRFVKKEIVEALRNKNLEPALKWCSINARGSWFHFNLECQKYIELVRQNYDKTLVIKCAKKLAEEFWDSYEDDLQHILPALAFGCKTEVHRYKKLFDADRWDLLETLFKHKFNLTHKFTQFSSSLWILMEAGMIALKVPFCYDEDCNKDDPLQHEYFHTFASSLPYAIPSSPTLLCWVTKEPLTEENPPYMLPNGYAYSKEAISKMQNGEEITCLRTGSVFKKGDVRKLKLDRHS